jgi:hypothetical protein
MYWEVGFHPKSLFYIIFLVSANGYWGQGKRMGNGGWPTSGPERVLPSRAGPVPWIDLAAAAQIDLSKRSAASRAV